MADDKTYVIKRDADGNVLSVGNTDVPYGYSARYYISEWGPFWDSDIKGGDLGFFVMMESVDKVGDYVNYLYKEDKLVAELLYSNVFLQKARTYNRHGAMVQVYEHVDADFLTNAFYDYSTTSKW